MKQNFPLFLGIYYLNFCYPFVINLPTTTRQKGTAFRVRACIVPPCAGAVVEIEAGNTNLLRSSDERQECEANIEIIQSETDEYSLGRAASLMVDAYWLNSPTSLILPEPKNSKVPHLVPDAVREKLIRAQLSDFVDRYDGDRSDRLLHSLLLKAVGSETDDVLGIVGIEVRICDYESNIIHSLQKSEDIIRQATKSISEYERKRLLEHPNCVPKAVDTLLHPDLKAVCVLSNLAVSPQARRKGLGKKLCLEVEKVAQSYCGCDVIYLEVEENNFVARKLYEEKLGYSSLCLGNAPAQRVDLTSGSFVDVIAPTIVMAKSISSNKQTCTLTDTPRQQNFSPPPLVTMQAEPNPTRAQIKDKHKNRIQP
jgi:ribosomal protein S18 acetylase RimI-like enzyme